MADYILETIADEGEWRSAAISSRTAQKHHCSILSLWHY